MIGVTDIALRRHLNTYHKGSNKESDRSDGKRALQEAKNAQSSFVAQFPIEPVPIDDWLPPPVEGTERSIMCVFFFFFFS